MTALHPVTKRRLERNITIHYITAGLSWMRFFLPVLALFYIASQVTLAQFGIIMGVFALTIAVLNVPMGVVADFIGKKRVLILARTCYVIEIAILAFMNGFWPLLIAKVISGVGVALAAGAYEGMLFDSLKRLGREAEHKRLSGRATMIFNITLAAVSVTGAWLFTINHKLPALISLPIAALQVAVTMCFYEPYPPKGTMTVRKSLIHLRESWQFTWREPATRYILFYTLAIYAGLNVLWTMESSYLPMSGISLKWLGVVIGTATLITAFAANKAHRIIEYLGDSKTLVIVGVTMILGFFVTSSLMLIPVVAAFFIAAAAWGVYLIGTNDFVNHHAPTSHRVTVLSICGISGQFSSFVLLPAFSTVAQNYSMSLAILSLSITCLIAYTVAEVVRKTHKVI